jgi:hypothetical protein
MKIKLLALFFLFFGLSSGVAADTLRLFGRTFDKSVLVWGSAIAPPGVTESIRENAKFELYVKPAITLKRFSEKTSLVAYSVIGFFQDSQKFSYDNKITLAFGSEIQYKLSKAVSLSYGGQWKVEHEFSTGAVRSRFVLTADASVYRTWRPVWIQKRFRPGSQLVLSGWANYRYPGSLYASEKTNGQAQAALKLAIDMPIGETKLRLSPFTSIKLKADHLGRSYNNTIEPALGFDVKIPVAKGGSIALGTKTSAQWQHTTGKITIGNQFYVTWYKKY